MQERQTQVLALPARAEGRDRETEGILGKKKGSPGSRKRSMVFQDMPNVSMQVLEIISAGLDRCCDAAERPDEQWEANRASIILNASREYSEYSADPWAGYMPTVATVGRYRSRGKKQAKRNLPQLTTAARHQLRRAMPASVQSRLPASYLSPWCRDRILQPPPPLSSQDMCLVHGSRIVAIFIWNKLRKSLGVPIHPPFCPNTQLIAHIPLLTWLFSSRRVIITLMHLMITVRRGTLKHRLCESPGEHGELASSQTFQPPPPSSFLVGYWNKKEVEVILGVDAGRDVDVELEQLQEVTLHLVPAENRHEMSLLEFSCIGLQQHNGSFMVERKHSHVLHCDVFEDLAVVDVPHSLVVPDLGGQQDGAENDPLPVTGTDVHLSVRQQPFQVPVSSLTSSVVVMGHSSSSTSLLWILGLSPGEMQQDTEPPIFDLQQSCYSQQCFPYNSCSLGLI
ncbi:hypothetical protein F7725_009291 [Dissostichus mawsoni]|uniref:Uncharacterized protein n=1 Tax=Dissostichus mawsoni TaxID=36200 RepID=A0A7J5Z8F8_DISMA|nr:hypothetical protein F7725_009291 [Dissostichus mawsoni]